MCGVGRQRDGGLSIKAHECCVLRFKVCIAVGVANVSVRNCVAHWVLCVSLSVCARVRVRVSACLSACGCGCGCVCVCVCASWQQPDWLIVAHRRCGVRAQYSVSAPSRTCKKRREGECE